MRLAFLVLLLFPILSSAEVQMEDCQGGSLSPSDRNICFGEAVQNSREELSRTYDEKVRYFSKGGPCYSSDGEIDCAQAYNALVKSQTAWGRYGDAKCAFVSSMFNWKIGKADIPYWEVQRCVIETNRTRTYELKGPAP